MDNGNKKVLTTALEKAVAAIAGLNLTGREHKRLSLDETLAAAERILQRYRVQSLLQVDYETIPETTHKRAYGDSPARSLTETKVQIQAVLDPDAYAQTQRLLG